MYVTTVYVIADADHRPLNVNDDPQSKMSNAEVITFAIVRAKFFYGNHKLTRYLCKQLGLFPEILSNSRLNRRIHKIPWSNWYAVFRFLSFLSVNAKNTHSFAVDSFPVCVKSRIDKRKRFSDRAFIGFAASKNRYFFGIKVYMLVANLGRP